VTKTYLLIDLQNRQPAPESVASWMGANGEAWVFYGEQEIGLLARYMELGDQVSLVDISKPGKNSLDFHLVLYLGYLVGRHEPEARFVIVAGDGDYDPAVVHARSKGRRVERVEVLERVPVQVESVPLQRAAGPQSSTASTPMSGSIAVTSPPTPRAKRSKSVDQISFEILKDLAEAGKPKTLDALKKRIQSRFGQEPVPGKVAEVLSRLVALNVIRITDELLQYMDCFNCA
jgi:hypothetical protein